MATYKLSDGIEFYLKVFKQISAIYTNHDETEVNISKKISEIVEELKETNDKKLVKEALTFIVSIFENYMSDDYNVSAGLSIDKISTPEKDIYKAALEAEIFPEEYQLAHVLNIGKIGKEKREIILSILKEELLK